jgi:hypothetical protein
VVEDIYTVVCDLQEIVEEDVGRKEMAGRKK